MREIDRREEMKAEGKVVQELGGLHVIGTERHEARAHRLAASRPLRPAGRSGQQPLLPVARRRPDADLRRRVGQEDPRPLGMKEGEAIESRMVSRRIEGAQKKVEERNFEIRKNLLEYDEVMDEQRKRVYGFRQRDSRWRQLPRAHPGHDRQADRPGISTTSCSAITGRTSPRLPAGLAAEFEPRHFRGTIRRSRSGQGRGRANAEGQVLEASTKTCPTKDEDDRMELGAMAKLANTRWGLSSATAI